MPLLTLTLCTDLEKAASSASGACGHFVENPAILRQISLTFDWGFIKKTWSIKDWQFKNDGVNWGWTIKIWGFHHVAVFSWSILFWGHCKTIIFRLRTFYNFIKVYVVIVGVKSNFYVTPKKKFKVNNFWIILILGIFRLQMSNMLFFGLES